MRQFMLGQIPSALKASRKLCKLNPNNKFLPVGKRLSRSSYICSGKQKVISLYNM